MSPRTGTCCVRRRCCASCPRSPWRRVSLPSGHELVRRAVAARRRRHSTRPADKGALVTPQPAVICARLHAQTPTPAPQPTRSSDATERCLWRCTRGPLIPQGNGSDQFLRRDSQAISCATDFLTRVADASAALDCVRSRVVNGRHRTDHRRPHQQYGPHARHLLERCRGRRHP